MLTSWYKIFLEKSTNPFNSLSFYPYQMFIIVFVKAPSLHSSWASLMKFMIHNLFKSILIMFSHLCAVLFIILFLLAFPTKALCQFLISFMSVAFHAPQFNYPSKPRILNLLLCNSLLYPVTSFFVGPN
jgi:hypothetical protein